MKQFFVFVLSGLAVVPAAQGTAHLYWNNANFSAPPSTVPQIDATNFYNTGPFFVSTLDVFDFSNVENFTNRNSMTGFPGFRFDTSPSSFGVPRPAKNFVNANNINAVLDNAGISASTHLFVSATNLINRGALTIGLTGVLGLQGDRVDLARSVLVAGDASGATPGGTADRYWGFGTNELDPLLNLGPTSPVVPTHRVIQPGGFTNDFFSFSVQNFPGFTAVQNVMMGPSNQSAQIVFLRNSNPNINATITFGNNTPRTLGPIRIEWNSIATNVFGQATPIYLTLTDTYGALTTNRFITNFTTGTLQPQNFSFFTSAFSNAFPNTGSPYTLKPQTFWGTNLPPDVVSNRYASYGVTIFNTTVNPSTTPGSPERTFPERARSMPGRIEVTADKVLDMTLTRVQGLNYVLFSGTNHFVGSTNANVITPYADMRLGSTNGVLNVVNPIQPTVQRFSGTIDMYSGVWSNALAFGTNTGLGVYQVLFVNSDLFFGDLPSILFDLDLRSRLGTNLGSITIGDTFYVNGHLFVEANQFTIDSNGELSLFPDDQDDGDWAGNVPYLQSFTNHGTLTADKAFNFYGRGIGPGGSDLPYTNFVNTGIIGAYGHIIRANYVENRGFIFSDFFFGGGIFIEAIDTVLLGDSPLNPGFLEALNSDIFISSGNLTISNQVVSPGRSLSLTITNRIQDGFPTTTNLIVVRDGFNLFAKPLTGDLRYTVVTNVAFDFQNVLNWWAGEDRGASVAGFTNNVALGKLALNGGLNSLFSFFPVGESNALYVGTLELIGSAALTNASGDLTGVFLAPGMKIYYANLRTNGAPAPVGLINGKNGGGFSFVSGYSGPPDLQVLGPAPAGVGYTASSVDLKVSLGSPPDQKIDVSWNTVANATNQLYFKSDFANTQWQLLTNFVSGVDGRVTVSDVIHSSARLYRVQVNLPGSAAQ